MDCLFCKIAAHEIPSYVVYEDEHALAFLDIHPKSPGHTMVISKVHAATFEELSREAVGQLFATVQMVSTEIKNRLHADALTLGVNDGAASGQA